MADLVVDVLLNPGKARPGGEPVLSEMIRQLWIRALRLIGCTPSSNAPEPLPSCAMNFITAFRTYVMMVVTEAEDRDEKEIRPVEDYLRIRRDTSGAKPTLALLEFGLDLPQEVITHSTIARMTSVTIDLIAIINDINSYIREFVRGIDGHNIVTAVIHEHNLTINESMDYLKIYAQKVVKEFLTARAALPLFDEDKNKLTESVSIRDRVQIYIDGLGN
ncbi:hypothetical protein AX16_005875 [Volvariella volvacea WC 439]|nr:hypothetical protein AX16_005875 [Volvariella volvacea WC 439]